jgi:molecular chaperone DnaK
MAVIGIDLGTTNSVVAVTDSNGITTTIAARDGARILPSVIHFPAGGEIVVGDRAKSMAAVEPERVASLFKRGMGATTFLANGQDFVVDGKTWRPEELSSLVLKKLKQVAEEHLCESVSRAVVTVPAYFGEAERSATRDAAELAGLDVVRILNEPTAAAIVHGIDSRARGANVLVFDLGGGTFDATVMRVEENADMTVLATGGDRKLGGADFDAAIVGLMAEHARREAGVDILSEAWMIQDARDKAEDMKKELSSAESSTRTLSTGARPLPFTLTRAEFEAAIADALSDVSDTVEVTLGESGIAAGDIDTVLMVGGSSRIPAFQKVLSDLVGREPEFSKNLDEDVARGAAVLATKLSGQADPRSELAAMAVPQEIASHGLGMTTVRDARTMEEMNSIIIPAGHSVPASGSDVFCTVEEGQTGIWVRINEGDEESLDFVRQIGEGHARFGRAVPAGYPMRVELSYTADQIVRLLAFDGESGDLIGEVTVQREGALSAVQKREALAAISQLGVQ